MSDSVKEEEQLLQDASTLLMFANVAAKQQQQHQHNPSPPISNVSPIVPKPEIHSSLIPQVPSVQLGPPMMNPNFHPETPAASILGSPPVITPMSHSASAENKQRLLPLPSIAQHQPYNSLPEIPSMRPHVNSIILNTPLMNTIPHVLGSQSQPQIPTQASMKSVTPPISKIAVSLSPSPRSPSQRSTYTPREIKPKPSRLGRSSISNLINSPEPQSISSNISHPEKVDIPHSLPRIIHKSVSPPMPKLPTQGNFQTHKRSQSTPEVKKRTKSFTSSQGPANVALSRGINIETGERNNNNAMIAAAALAAAADIPLPLKHVQQTIAIKGGRMVESGKAIEIKTTPPPQIKAQTPPQTDTIEEDQVTEPENDDDDDAKTEDERTDEEQGAKTDDESIPPDSDMPSQLQIQKEEAHVEGSNVQTTHSTLEDIRSKIERKDEEEQPLEPLIVTIKFVVPPLESYKVDPDSGLIVCICGIDDDDGFTIQCDVCYRWQHCLCMGFKTNEEVPEEEYQCYYCDKAKWGKFDPEACKYDTLHRLDADKSGIDDNESQQFQKHRQQQILQLQKQRQELQQQNSQNGGTKRKVLNSDKTDKKRKIEIDTEIKNENSISNNPIIDTLPNKDNELLKDGMTSESYQSVYFNVRFNDYKRPTIKEHLSTLGTAFYAEFLSTPKAEQQKKIYQGIEIMTANQFKALKLSQVILPNNQKYALENNKKNGSKREKFNKSQIQVKPYSDNQKQKFNGISKLSLFISSSSPDTLTIPKDTPIIEYLGEIDLFENYANDRINQYSSWGTMKPKVLRTNIHFSKDKDLDIVIDSRFVSNESRFIRKSCPSTSNCKIKQVYIPEKNSFQFLVVTSTPIVLKSETAEEELRLPWEWDLQHPIRKLYSPNNSEKFEQLSNSDKSSLISCIDNVLHFAECGCSTSSAYSTCAIFKVKKATSYLLRSTRKASSISNVNLTKSKEELILPKREKRFISWNERLIERDNYIRMRLSVTTDDMDVDKNEVEANVEETEIEDQHEKENKSSLLFLVPYKQQLLARSRSQKFYLDDEVSHRDDKPEIARDIPFLIVPDVVIKIEKSIDEQLMPMVSKAEAAILKQSAEIVPGVTEKLIDDEIRSAVVATIAAAVPTKTIEALPVPIEKPVQDEIIPAVVSVVHPTTVSTEIQAEDDKNITSSSVKSELDMKPQTIQPKVVKKLSFADYKKKMK
jgi:hypothetical protein